MTTALYNKLVQLQRCTDWVAKQISWQISWLSLRPGDLIRINPLLLF